MLKIRRGGVIVNWVAVGQTGNGIATSADAITWSGVTEKGGINAGNAVAYGNGLLVAVGRGGNTIATSTDGINWTGQTQTGGFLAYLPIVFVSVNTIVFI